MVSFRKSERRRATYRDGFLTFPFHTSFFSSFRAHTQDYWREKDEFPLIDLTGAEFVYSK